MSEPYIVFQNSQHNTYNKDKCQQTKITCGEYSFRIHKETGQQQKPTVELGKNSMIIHTVKLGPSTKFVIQYVNGLTIESKTFNNPYTDRETIINANMVCTNFFVEKYLPSLQKEKMHIKFGAYDALIIVFLLCLIVIFFDTLS